MYGKRERERFFKTPQELMSAARKNQYPHEKMQDPKRQTKYCYTEGPMYFLGQQIVKAMQDAGYPAKILYCYRSPELQRSLKAKGTTKAGPWESPHQYYEAVDIIHPGLAWKVSKKYWEALNACMRVVEQKYGVDLVHGHDWNDNGIPVYNDPKERFWDAAHIQLKDWKKVRDRHRAQIGLEGAQRPPNNKELWQRFEQVLPDVARRLERDMRGPGKPEGLRDLTEELQPLFDRWKNEFLEKVKAMGLTPKAYWDRKNGKRE